MPQHRESAFERYLHDIHDLELLDVAHEQQLLAQIGAARAAQQACEAPQPASERRLAQIVAAGQQARETLIAAHLRLVVRLARRFTGQGVSLLDLVQEGNLGLIQAIDHYDPLYGVRFATYAVWWIHHAILHAIDRERHPVRLPDHVRARLYRLFRARRELELQLGREPQAHELARATGLPPDQVGDVMHYLRPTVSLDQPLSEDAERTLADVIPDPDAELQLGAASHAALAAELEPLLRELSDEEREVLVLRFGLYGQRLCTVQDVAARLGVNSERVRQLEARALRKLRSSELVDRLHSFVDA